MKQIVMVLKAVQEGCNTARDVAAVTGLPSHVCSSWISALVKDGTLLRTGRKIPSSRIRDGGRGRPLLAFELTSLGR